MSFAPAHAAFENALPVPDRAPGRDRIPVLDYGATPPARATAAAAALPRPLVIGLTGPGGCGKSTVARALVAALPGAKIVHTATPMKAALGAILAAGGLTPPQVERRLDGDLKRVPCAILGGRTPTHAMQTLGTEWGRDLIHPDLWADLWRVQAEQALARGRAVINDSVRFGNEAAAIRALGGLVVRLTDRAGDLAATHSSEDGTPADLFVSNAGTPEATAGAILDAIAGRQIEAANRGAGGIWSRMMDALHGRADRPKW